MGGCVLRLQLFRFRPASKMLCHCSVSNPSGFAGTAGLLVGLSNFMYHHGGDNAEEKKCTSNLGPVACKVQIRELAYEGGHGMLLTEMIASTITNMNVYHNNPPRTRWSWREGVIVMNHDAFLFPSVPCFDAFQAGLPKILAGTEATQKSSSTDMHSRWWLN